MAAIIRTIRDTPTGEIPTRKEYHEAREVIEHFNRYAQTALDEARASGMGQGMQMGISPMHLNMFKLVQAYENRNWFVRLFGSKTTMVELV